MPAAIPLTVSKSGRAASSWPARLRRTSSTWMRLSGSTYGLRSWIEPSGVSFAGQRSDGKLRDLLERGGGEEEFGKIGILPHQSAVHAAAHVGELFEELEVAALIVFWRIFWCPECVQKSAADDELQVAQRELRPAVLVVERFALLGRLVA